MAEPLFMAEGRLPYLALGFPFRYRPMVSGGVPPYSFALTGSLPAGFAHSTTTGDISAESVAAETSVGPFVQTVTDSLGGTYSRKFALGKAPAVASPSLPLSPVIAGFYPNGAGYAAFKAGLARVKSGVGRLKVVLKGDSTFSGAGAGNSPTAYVDGAAAYRMGALLAAAFAGMGYPAADNSIVCDNAANVSSVSLTAYDPRVLSLGGWGVTLGQTLAGGGLISSAVGRLAVQFPAVNAFDVVAYNSGAGTLTFDIDGSPPASGGPTLVLAAGSGFSRALLTAADVGLHTLGITGSATTMAIRSITAYDATKSGIDIITHAALSATSANQSFTGSGWSNNDALGFDAPDLTIINLGLNDMRDSISPTPYANNIQNIINKAKLSGNVLVIFPHPAGQIYGAGPFYNTNSAAMRAAVSAVCATSGVAFWDMTEYFAGVVPTSKDGVHPDRPAYATIVGGISRIIDYMRRT